MFHVKGYSNGLNELSAWLNVHATEYTTYSGHERVVMDVF